MRLEPAAASGLRCVSCLDCAYARAECPGGFSDDGKQHAPCVHYYRCAASHVPVLAPMPPLLYGLGRAGATNVVGDGEPALTIVGRLPWPCLQRFRAHMAAYGAQLPFCVVAIVTAIDGEPI